MYSTTFVTLLKEDKNNLQIWEELVIKSPDSLLSVIFLASVGISLLVLEGYHYRSYVTRYCCIYTRHCLLTCCNNADCAAALCCNSCKDDCEGFWENPGIPGRDKRPGKTELPAA